MKSTTRERFIELVEKRYPCATLPPGAYVDIAAELGVSRARAQQLGAELGMTVGHHGRRPVARCACLNCGTAFYRKGGMTGLYCSQPCRVEHTALHLVCDQCGESYALTGVLRTRFLNNRKQKPGVTRQFCSQRCFGDSIRNLPPVSAGERRRPFSLPTDIAEPSPERPFQQHAHVMAKAP